MMAPAGKTKWGLRFAEYDFDRAILILTYNSGAKYAYYGVSPVEYAALLIN